MERIQGDVIIGARTPCFQAHRFSPQPLTHSAQAPVCLWGACSSARGAHSLNASNDPSCAVLRIAGVTVLPGILVSAYAKTKESAHPGVVTHAPHDVELVWPQSLPGSRSGCPRPLPHRGLAKDLHRRCASRENGPRADRLLPGGPRLERPEPRVAETPCAAWHWLVKKAACVPARRFGASEHVGQPASWKTKRTLRTAGSTGSTSPSSGQGGAGVTVGTALGDWSLCRAPHRVSVTASRLQEGQEEDGHVEPQHTDVTRAQVPPFKILAC